MCLSIKVYEPARVLAEGVHDGHEYVITYNVFGHRCGYVKVEPGHPWHGKHAAAVRNADGEAPDVHGSLNFAEPDVPCEAEGEDAGWWFGFDCGHAHDAPDPELAQRTEKGRHMLEMNRRIAEDFGLEVSGVVRSQAYVEEECRSLARQAREAAQ